MGIGWLGIIDLTPKIQSLSSWLIPKLVWVVKIFCIG
jgi:hypothetical protein